MTKILIIEDNEANRYLVRFMCEKEGYKIFEAVNGEDGVELARKEKLNLILMDIQLPGIDGLDAIKAIRKTKTNNTVPIIALTSYAMAGDKERALKVGCNGYIEKPIDPETFIDEIKEYLK